MRVTASRFSTISVVERGVSPWVSQWGPGRQWANLGPHVPASYMSVGPPNLRAQTHNPTSNLNSSTTSLGKMTKRDKITELHHETWQRRATASPYAYAAPPPRGLVKGSPPGLNSTLNADGTESPPTPHPPPQVTYDSGCPLHGDMKTRQGGGDALGAGGQDPERRGRACPAPRLVCLSRPPSR